MDLDFVKAFGSEYIKHSDGGRKLDHHAYRLCVELLDRHETGPKLSLAEANQLYQDIQNLEKKEKRQFLTLRYQRLFSPVALFNL